VKGGSGWRAVVSTVDLLRRDLTRCSPITRVVGAQKSLEGDDHD
jgi:hypothetical protein